MPVQVSQHLIVASTFVLTLVCVLSSVVVGRLRGGYVGPPTAFLRGGKGVPWVSCLDPPVCPRVQDDPEAKSQPFLVWLLLCFGVVTSCVLCARVSRVLRDVLTTGCISCATENTYTTHRVSPYLADPEMNWTSSFLLKSDKLAIVPHLPLAPGGTVGQPAEHESGHRPSPSPEEVSRCFPQNCGRSHARLMEE